MAMAAAAAAAASARSRPQYIIEHMEELDADSHSPATFPQWALLEYRHMLMHVGAGSIVHFTGLVAKASRDALDGALRKATANSSISSSISHAGGAQPVADFEVHIEGVLDVAKQLGVALKEICLLDPKAPVAISVADAGLHERQTPPLPALPDGPFRFFLFGGILGDDPPRDRTSALRAMGFPSRHLGAVQMSTDTALGVTKRVVEDGLALNLPNEGMGEVETRGPSGNAIDYIDSPELDFGNGESVVMPYRYMIKQGTGGTSGKAQPLLPPEMREHIKKDLDRSIEF